MIPGPIVNQKEVIAGSLVFVEMNDGHELFHLFVVHILSALDVAPFGCGLPV